jgi:rubrerythrin
MPKDFSGFLKVVWLRLLQLILPGKIETTKDNLFAAAEGEHEEWSDLYPAFASYCRRRRI